MNAKNFLCVVLGLCCFDVGALSQEQQHSTVRILDYLNIVGPKLGCHFTVESREPVAGARWKLLDLVTNDPNIASILQLVSKLRRDMEGFSVDQDSKNPKIVHIIEQALGNDKDYVLNKRISFKYSGHIHEDAVWDSKRGYYIRAGGLLFAASKEAPGLRDQTIASGNWSGVGDYVTEVNIDVTNETVRSIFTGCVSLANYSPVLWEAVATAERGKPVVWVLFSGPKKP